MSELTYVENLYGEDHSPSNFIRYLFYTDYLCTRAPIPTIPSNERELTDLSYFGGISELILANSEMKNGIPIGKLVY